MSASELAQMGTCERLMLLERLLGKRRTAEQDEASRRGLAAHARFFDESQRLMTGEAHRKTSKTGRCFVATLLLDDSDQARGQLATLRALRDQVLKPTKPGRWFVLRYYQVGPSLCRILIRHACLQRPVRAMVVALAWLSARYLGRNRASS